MPTMRAVVLDAPDPPAALALRELPVPEPRPGWVLLRVEAFGLNRSELHTRLGLAGPDVTYPRVLGIEASGVVEAAPGTSLRPGQKAVALMGDMGRSFDGGYAEYTLVPAGQVIPVDTELDWAGLGALPEALQTAYGSLTTGVGARDTDVVLIHGGTSAVGILTALLAKRRGMTVLSTTRREERRDELLALGVDHALIDHGRVAEEVRDLISGGVDGAVELVGPPPCGTPCAPPSPGEPSASPACCRTSGSSRTSIPSTSSPRACA